MGGAATVALWAVPATAAHAAAGCWDSGFKVSISTGTYEAFYCYNVSPTAVYNNVYHDSQVGTLTSDPRWFLFRVDNGAPNGEAGPHPTRWVYTQSDTGAWGWVSDHEIFSETDPISGC